MRVFLHQSCQGLHNAGVLFGGHHEKYSLSAGSQSHERGPTCKAFFSLALSARVVALLHNRSLPDNAAIVAASGLVDKFNLPAVFVAKVKHDRAQPGSACLIHGVNTCQALSSNPSLPVKVSDFSPAMISRGLAACRTRKAITGLL